MLTRRVGYPAGGPTGGLVVDHDLRSGSLPFMRGAKKGATKRIVEHTVEELDAAVEQARELYGEHFWKMLHGIDAFMERRYRKGGSYDRTAALEAEVAELRRVLANAGRSVSEALS